MLKILCEPINYYSSYLHSLEKKIKNNYDSLNIYGLKFISTSIIVDKFDNLVETYRLIVYYPHNGYLISYSPLKISHTIRFFYKFNNILYKMKLLYDNENPIFEDISIHKKKNLHWLIYFSGELAFICDMSIDTSNEYYFKQYLDYADKSDMIIGLIDIDSNKSFFKSRCKYYIPKNKNNIYKIKFIGKYTNEFNTNFYKFLY